MIIGETPLPEGPLGVDAVAVTMKFGDFLALDNVALKVRPGSFHALLGENGAGKSTLVKCIMGYYHATAGDILVGGREQAIANPKDAHALGLGMVYQHFTLVPAMTVRARLAMVKQVEAGDSVSYGATWTAEHPTSIGLVPVGYGDGVPRHASNAAEVAVGGKRRPIRGRLRMDQFVVDLDGDLPGAGEEVVLFGAPVDGRPTAQDWAEACDTINYEIVSRIGGRMTRRYVDGDSGVTA